MTDEQVEAVIARLDAVEAKPYAERIAKEYSAATLAELEAISPDGDRGEILYEMVDYLLKRKR
jgi:geranylgeranyl pyrophosphate synthase